MELIRTVKLPFTNMETVTKRILLIGYCLFVLSYLVGFAVLFWYYKCRMDYTTGYYWYLELCMLAKELIGATAVPALLFELVWIGQGFKQSGKL